MGKRLEKGLGHLAGAVQRGGCRTCIRGFGFPGADEYGNMFQVYRDFEKEVNAARSIDSVAQAQSGAAELRSVAGGQEVGGARGGQPGARDDRVTSIPNSQFPIPKRFAVLGSWKLEIGSFRSHASRPSSPHTISRMFRFRSLVVFCGAAMVFAAVAFPPITTFGQARQATADPCAGARDLHLTNGKIVTMDGRGSTVSEVTIQDGRFTAVGPRGSQRLSPCTREINLRGRTVVPGLIDNHNHIVLLGIRPGYHTPLEGAASIADVQAILKARAKSVPAGAFITSMGGWNPAQFTEKRLPTLAELDAATSDHPVLVFQAFTGPAATNTPGKDVLREQGRRRQRHRADRRERAVAGGAQRAARGADLRRQEARHTGRDGLLRQRRRHHERRHGRIQSAWHARPSGLVRGRHAGQRQPVPRCTTRSSRCIAKAR